MLPELLPMLAVPAAPFDSSEYSFEVKKNGVRALAAVETAGWRLWGRERADYTARYPKLEVLRRLPAGSVERAVLGVAEALTTVGVQQVGGRYVTGADGGIGLQRNAYQAKLQ
jgi:hypothetical protein